MNYWIKPTIFEKELLQTNLQLQFKVECFAGQIVSPQTTGLFISSLQHFNILFYIINYIKLQNIEKNSDMFQWHPYSHLGCVKSPLDISHICPQQCVYYNVFNMNCHLIIFEALNAVVLALFIAPIWWSGDPKKSNNMPILNTPKQSLYL